jgi:hypothetical protein
MSDNDKPRVWVVYTDRRKDLSAAEKFGQLTDMFYYNNVDMKLARRQAFKMLKRYKPGDYILPIGDPILCGIVMTVAAQNFAPNETITVLRWDRKELEYTPEVHVFALDEDEEAFLEEHLEKLDEAPAVNGTT